VVDVGDFARGGKSRKTNKAYDHDFSVHEKLIPFGMLLPATSESYIWFSTSKVTADFMVDRLEDVWPKLNKKYSPHTLVINVDNGPEYSGSRTQWLKRLVDFSQREGVKIRLAYYPPYHSEYNPLERLWGVLENHWRGELLTTIEKTLGLARSMTYKLIHPVVKIVRKVYPLGVTVKKSEMKEVEKSLLRKETLDKWFIDINL
jgi:transposase